MQLSFAAIILGIAAVASALPQDAAIVARENGNRPVATGACCIANTSLKQDACKTANGQAGRCVPGGNNCGGRLSCVAQANLACDATIIERGKSLCRAKVAGGFQDGARVVKSLKQAKVN